MTWPALVVILLVYAVIGAAVAAAAHAPVWNHVVDRGTPGSPHDGGLGTVWVWACSLGLCLLAGLGWFVVVPAWHFYRRRTS